MQYELDFIGTEEKTKDADAICFRYYNESLNRFVTVVYDGGFTVHGERLVNHLKKYYFNETVNPSIDFVICSHPDQDHVLGLTEVINNFKVKKLIMNRPWVHINELMPFIDDGRITEQSLEDRLKEEYKYIAELEELAIRRGVEIADGFQGELKNTNLKIVSPTKDFYLNCIIESCKTPLEELRESHSLLEKAKKIIKYLLEKWDTDSLKEDVKTSSENESSIIVLGDMGEEKFLLTGDAGVKALNEALNYMNLLKIDPKKINLYQIPHHGSRHNVSPSILNRLVGSIIDQKAKATRSAFVSVAIDSENPKAMVTNAFTRRGVKVYKTAGKTICHHKETPQREGWTKISKIEFQDKVEAWDD